MNKIDANIAFEQALVDVTTQAVDGQGQLVALLHGPFTTDNLRRVTRNFMEALINRDTVFLAGLSIEGQQHAAQAEAAAWDNLALLARATAAAVRAGA